MIDGDDVGVGRPVDTALRLSTLTVDVDGSVDGRQYATETRPESASRVDRIGAIVMGLCDYNREVSRAESGWN